jgi:hypothetical protein
MLRSRRGSSNPVRRRAATNQQAPSRSSWSSHLATWLANPLLVTVVAALLGSWLLPQITRKWQDHQKALEIQTGLVSEMSETVSSAVATGRFIAAGLVAKASPDPRAEQRAWNDGYREWTTTSASIGARLRAYFGPNVSSEWQSFSYVVTDFVLLSAKPTRDGGREDQVAEILRYADRLKDLRLSREQWILLSRSREGVRFQSAYAQVGRGLLARGDELVQRVLDSSVSGF